jgi:hypothetical protein
MFSKSTNAATSLRPLALAIAVGLAVAGGWELATCADWEPFATSKPRAGVATGAPFSSCICTIELPGPISGTCTRCAHDATRGLSPVFDCSPCFPYAQSHLTPEPLPQLAGYISTFGVAFYPNSAGFTSASLSRRTRRIDAIISALPRRRRQSARHQRLRSGHRAWRG